MYKLYSYEKCTINLSRIIRHVKRKQGCTATEKQLRVYNVYMQVQVQVQVYSLFTACRQIAKSTQITVFSTGIHEFKVQNMLLLLLY